MSFTKAIDLSVSHLCDQRYSRVVTPGGYRLSCNLYRQYLERVKSPSLENFVRLSWMDGPFESVVYDVESAAHRTALVVLRDVDMLVGEALHRAVNQLVAWTNVCSEKRPPWDHCALLVCSGLSHDRLRFRARGWKNEPHDIDYAFSMNRFGEPHVLTGTWRAATEAPELIPLDKFLDGHAGLARAALEGLETGWRLDEVEARLVERMRSLAESVRADLGRRVPDALSVLDDLRTGFHDEAGLHAVAPESMDALLRWDVVRERGPALVLGPEPWRRAVGAASDPGAK